MTRFPLNSPAYNARFGVRFLLLSARVKMFIFIGTNVGASLGWAAGEPFGMMAAFIVSGIGSAAGVYAGWWAARRWL